MAVSLSIGALLGSDIQAEAAVRSVRSKTIGSLQSARVSVPPLFVKDEQEKDPNLRFKWRTNLIASQPYWEGEYLYFLVCGVFKAGAFDII